MESMMTGLGVVSSKSKCGFLAGYSFYSSKLVLLMHNDGHPTSKDHILLLEMENRTQTATSETVLNQAS
jgi:hypothetical protein